MNELHESNPTQNTQEAALHMLPYDHAALARELGDSIEFVKNYGAVCVASLDGEKERLARVEAVTGQAIEHSLALQNEQGIAYTELANAGNTLIALFDTKRTTEIEAAGKRRQLATELEKQVDLNAQAEVLQTNLDEGLHDSMAVTRSYTENQARLGAMYCATGTIIRRLQSELGSIQDNELPDLINKISQELARIERLHTDVLAITKEIEELPAPADDPKNHDLYQVSEGARHYQREISTDNKTVTESELSRVEGFPVRRTRALGTAAIDSVVEEGGLLRRIKVSFRPFQEPSVKA